MAYQPATLFASEIQDVTEDIYEEITLFSEVSITTT